MTKLTKAQLAQLAELQSAYSQAAVDFNEARNALDAFRDEIHAEIETYIGEKSDKWQEGDRGAAFSSWLDSWGEDLPDELETDPPEYPEAPED